MRRGLLRAFAFAASVFLASIAARVAIPHETDFPLPLLAPTGAAADIGSNLGFRPRQPAGQGLPLKPTRRIAFETDEGTWMSVDVAPGDGHLVFDLLGDIYSLPAAGGRATALTHGLPFDAQPTFSPDGEWIAFVSDRSGAENVWIMRADGSQARQISFGDDDTVLVSPAWSADGRSIYVSRFLWSVAHYELWRYGLDGSEKLIVPIKEPGAPRDAGMSSLGAAVSPDGREIYFARRIGSSDDDEKVDTWSIVRRDVESGVERTVVPEGVGAGKSPGGAYFRPALSPDGRRLAYATRFEGKTGLRLRDLATGEDRWLAFPIEHDQLQASSWQDLVPRHAFTRDGKALLLSRGGKLERLSLEDGASAPIPFQAAVDIELGPLTRVEVKQETGPVRARLMQTPEQSPDGRSVAFSSLGHLYVMPLRKGGKPRRLTSLETPEFHPSWSPDGRRIAFVTWAANEAGHVWVVPVGATGASGQVVAQGAPRRLSETADFYTRPVFSPDGKEILAVRSSHRARLERIMDFGLSESSLVAWPADGGAAREVYSGPFGGKPHFAAGGVAADGATVYVQSSGGLTPIDLTSGTARPATLLKGPGWYFMEGVVPVDDARISPDGHWVLAFVAQQLHLIQAPQAGSTVNLEKPGLRHRRITDVGADYFEWADGGRTITWSVGSTFYRRPLNDVRLNDAGEPGWSADAPSPKRGTQAFEAVVEVPRDDPAGDLLMRGARVITMRGEEVIEDADVLIHSGRVAALGKRGSVATPKDAEVRDVSGKTIVPGFIDIHDHVADIRRDVIATESWGLRARLAYGITTAFDPSSLSIDMFAYQDMVDAGILTGSRVPTTGMAMFSFNRLASLDEARALITRYRDHYRTHNIKQYLIGNRRQRQWLVQAAEQMGVMPTTEGSLSLKLDLGQIMDGFSGSEHALPTPLYRDVIELVARSRTSYDGTLQITNGGPPAQNQFVVRDHPLGDAKFMRFRPYVVADRSVAAREWSDPSALLYPRIGGDAARIQRAGGVVAMGSHGEIPGVGFHWEMEAHVQGGMTPWEALRAGTMGGAEAIGRASEFGSIEPGKIADLVVLNGDPRSDIRLSRDIAWVMRYGRLYDADTLAELWPRRKPLERQWFDGERPAGSLPQQRLPGT